MRIDRTAITPATVGSVHRTILLAAIATLAPHIAAADIIRHGSIPDAYIGRWAPGTGACKESDKSVVVLSAKAYDSPEATCTVDWVSETPGATRPYLLGSFAMPQPRSASEENGGVQYHYSAGQRPPDRDGL